MKWFRLFTEARNDAKLRHLKDDEHRVWFNLLCFSGEQQDRGVIEYHSYPLLAVEVANGDEDLLQRTLEKLSMLRIVEDKDGAIAFVNFKKRQYDNPSDEPKNVRKRVKKCRDKKRNENETTCNDQTTSETPPDTDTESDTDTEKDLKEDEDYDTRARAEIFQQFEQEFGRPLSPFETEMLRTWFDEHPEELISEALKEAVKHSARNFSYIDRILGNWEKNSVRTVQEAKDYQSKFKQNRPRGDPMNDICAELDKKYADIYIT